MNHSDFRPEVTPHGIKIGNTTINFVDAVQRLNDGEYDNPYWHGLRIMQCIAEADDAGFPGKIFSRYEGCSMALAVCGNVYQ